MNLPDYGPEADWLARLPTLREGLKYAPDELRDMPFCRDRLAPNELLVHDALEQVLFRHQFYEHDCQFIGCLVMFVHNSAEMTAIQAESYWRGYNDAKAEK